LFHVTQKLHPLRGQDLGVYPLAKYWEYMKLQRADGSGGRSIRPVFALGGVPLPRQVLKRIVGRLDLGSLPGSLGGEWVSALGCILS
jgi:hypothetical protein